MLSNNIISERLIIRDVSQDDAKDIWEIWSNSENEKYMCDPVESIEQVISICKMKKNHISNGFLRVATLKDTGEVIGTCCFGPTNEKNEWGFGYSIKQDCWGKGFATEMVKSVIAFGCSLGITDFISSCATENVSSGRVLEKCGMHINHKASIRQPKLNITYESQVYKIHID